MERLKVFGQMWFILCKKCLFGRVTFEIDTPIEKPIVKRREVDIDNGLQVVSV